jgi:hypothetical protein
LVVLARGASSRAARGIEWALREISQDKFPAVGEEGLGNRKAGPDGLPHSYAPVFVLPPPLAGLREPASRRIPRKKQIAEGLVFASKAGNKPSKDGW